MVAEQLHVDPEEGIFDALQELAAADNTDAMIVLANLHARKIAPRASKRNAIRWYKRAIKAAPENPDVVNEVAWTLTVSDIAELRQPRYAKRIMDKLMRRSDEAQQRRIHSGRTDGGHRHHRDSGRYRGPATFPVQGARLRFPRQNRFTSSLYSLQILLGR